MRGKWVELDGIMISVVRLSKSAKIQLTSRKKMYSNLYCGIIFRYTKTDSSETAVERHKDESTVRASGIKHRVLLLPNYI